MLQLLFTLGIGGFIIFFFVLDGDKNKVPYLNKTTDAKKSSSSNKKGNSNIKNVKFTQKYLPFKDIKTIGSINDKALIIKNNNQYVGVLEVFGINYNLLSIDERLVLEEIFQMMLNGLDYPIQIFIQSRSMDIENYEKIYTDRLEEINQELKKEESKLNFSLNKGDIEETSIIKRNMERVKRQIAYGENVLEFIKAISYNADILDKKYFIATSYYYDRSLFNQEQTEEEKFETAFNTINNRLESILQSLKGANLEGKFLNGIEVAELLYTSFNKDDSDKYRIGNAFESDFSNLIVTSKPVELKMFENEKQKLEEEMFKEGLMG